PTDALIRVEKDHVVVGDCPITFPFDKGSNAATLNGLYQVDEAGLRALAIALGFDAPGPLPLAHVKLIVSGTIQNFWFRQVKGEVPAGVLANHNERLNKYEDLVRRAKEKPESFTQEQAVDGKVRKVPTGRPASTSHRRYTLDAAQAQEVLPKLKGQPALVVSVMQSLGKPATLKEISDAVAGTGRLTTRQPVERVVAYYLNQWSHSGLITSEKATGPAPESSAPVESATPITPAEAVAIQAET